jgi:hypothetical protein
MAITDDWTKYPTRELVDYKRGFERDERKLSSDKDSWLMARRTWNGDDLVNSEEMRSFKERQETLATKIAGIERELVRRQQRKNRSRT